MLTFGILLGIFFGLTNFFTNGFITTFLRIKASRGKKVLVKIRGRVHDYFKIGESKDGFLIYRDLKKQTRTISLPNSSIYRCLNVYWVDVDEEKNAVVDHDFNIVSGFDAVKWNYYLEQALNKPNMNNDNTILIVVLILAGFTLLLAIAILITLTKGNTQILFAIEKSASVIGSNVGVNL